VERKISVLPWETLPTYQKIGSKKVWGGGINVVNIILNPQLRETKVKDGAGLLNPLQNYLRSVGIYDHFTIS
jgi:hypothetical protein